MNSENAQGFRGQELVELRQRLGRWSRPETEGKLDPEERPVRCWPASLACSNACLLARAESAHRWRAFVTATAKNSHT